MLRSLLILTLSFLLSCSTTPKPSLGRDLQVALSPKDLLSSIGRIRVSVGDAGYSATAWAPDTDLVFTAAHFCLGAIQLSLSTQTEANFSLEYVDIGSDEVTKIDGLQLLDINPITDLCALYSEDHGMIALPIADSVERGERVFNPGAPLGYFPVLNECFVLSLNSSEAGLNVPAIENRLTVSCPVTHGSSGSPVVNLKGEVVSTINLVHPAYEHTAFGPNNFQVKDFLNRVLSLIKD